MTRHYEYSHPSNSSHRVAGAAEPYPQYGASGTRRPPNGHERVSLNVARSGFNRPNYSSLEPSANRSNRDSNLRDATTSDDDVEGESDDNDPGTVFKVTGTNLVAVLRLDSAMMLLHGLFKDFTSFDEQCRGSKWETGLTSFPE